jgi:glycerol-3-phosphate dehydrogenase subunit B
MSFTPKFDTIIIGGGLSGLTCAISLSKKGQKCAVISAGQSALHFCSGSFDLLGYSNGSLVNEPLKAIASLPETHPYSLLGADRVASLTASVKPFFSEMGITFHGDESRNHFRITPMGGLKPTWLTLSDFTPIETADSLPWKKAAILNVSGFLDFHTAFIADGLEKFGVECSISAFSLPETDRIRKNPSEMRSSNLARIFEEEETLRKLVPIVNERGKDADIVILPSVFGLFSSRSMELLKSLTSVPICLLPAIPPSVPGIRVQYIIREYFRHLGGIYTLGDTVASGKFNGDVLKSISTVNQGDIELKADNFVLASGSFFSHGLAAQYKCVYEPIFNLDVVADADRSSWCDSNFFESQPYMSYGVATDADFHAKLGGKSIRNLYVAGSVLSGFNPVKESCGAGVSILTALHVADLIAKK